MVQPVLKSIHPVNLLSFGPKTEPIELQSLNVLIGANGSGKSNLLELIRLLHLLPDKDPWRTVLRTGGVDEWVWKGAERENTPISLTTDISLPNGGARQIGGNNQLIRLSLEFVKFRSTFRLSDEEVRSYDPTNALHAGHFNTYRRYGSQGAIHLRETRRQGAPVAFDLHPERSILSQLSSPSVQSSGIGVELPELSEIAELFDKFDFHQDWEFGVGCPPRDPQPVGQPFETLNEDGENLPQMLAYFRDNHKSVFAQLEASVKKFYEAAKRVEVRLISTHNQIFIEEEDGWSTPATRLSDGMMRWLAMLCVLLNPTPAPVTCIDEPELGLHPDVIPTLADLLRDASTRTQLIVTTHSAALVDAFSDEPEAVCVCEKIEGSTVIQRLNEEELSVWLEKYSLGNLWTSGQIGGNRW